MSTAKKKDEQEALYQAGLQYIDDGDFIFTMTLSKAPLSNKAMSKALGREIVSPNGGHHVATDDKEEWRKMCAIPDAAEIAINLQKSGKVCHDIDFRKGAEGANRKLRAYFNEHLKEAVDAGLADHHKSQNGGEHVITLDPGGDLPGYIYPELQIKRNGYVLLPGPSGRYSVIKRAEEELRPLPPSAFVIKERVRGNGGGSIMPLETVIDILSRNHEGLRHEAVKDLCWSVVRENQNADIFEASSAAANIIAAHLPPDAERDGKNVYDELTNLTFNENEGERDSELVRAMRPLMVGGSLRTKALGSDGTERLAHALSAYIEERGEVIDLFGNTIRSEEVQKEHEQAKKKQRKEANGGLFTRYSRDTVEELPGWALENFLRYGDIGAMVGLSNVGKTNISALLVATITSGRSDVFGMEIDRPLATAWLNAEEDRAALQHRVAAAQVEHNIQEKAPLFIAGKQQLMSGDDDLSTLIRSTREGPEINTDLRDLYIEEMSDLGVEFLNIEPITEFHGGQENAREDARLLYRVISQIIDKLDATALYWAHTKGQPEGKGPDWYRGDVYAIRGSTQLAGNASASGTLTPVVQGGNATEKTKSWNDARAGRRRNVIEMTMAKARMAPTYPNLFFELRSSKHNPQVPVAALFDAGDVPALSLDKFSTATRDRQKVLDIAATIGTAFEDRDKLTQKALRDATQIQSFRFDRGIGKAVLNYLKAAKKVGDATIQIKRSGETYRLSKS